MSTDVIILDSETFAIIKKCSAQNIETILLDNNADGEDDDIIIQENFLYDGDKKTNLYDQLIKKDKLFVELIDKCLEIENSIEMRKVVNKTLLNAYLRASKAYLLSEDYRKALLKAIKLLDTDPDKKFQHIKYFYETLTQQRMMRKRVKLTTLETNLKKKYHKHKHIEKVHNKPIRKAPPNIIEVYELDSDTDKDEVISVDDDPVVPTIVLDDVELSQNDEKKNNVENIMLSLSPYKGSVEQSLLTPQREITYSYGAPENNASRIQRLEATIGEWNKKIKILEEMEVTSDTSMESPYLISERLKGEVVNLYKQLCTLKGEQAFKKPRVSLKVREGHPRRPTELLEELINEREDHEIQFPDYEDVVGCVLGGVKEEGLKWSKTQVMREANTLFTQCGKALQRYRQKREWKDLMWHVKEERMVDDDPAERDPELLAKLEENKRIAQMKEKDLLERYSAMQSSSSTTKSIEPNTTTDVTVNGDSVHDTDSDESNTDTEDSDDDSMDIIIPAHVDNVNEDDKGVNENNKDVNEHTNDNEVETNEDCNEIRNLEVKYSNENEVTNRDSNGMYLGNEYNNEIHSNNNNTEGIKTEPVEDIQSILDALSDNYTISITDIEDPFLVIDISSDSSDDEECDKENDDNS